MADNPSMDFLISVLPQAIYILILSGSLILIAYLPIKLSTRLKVLGSATFRISISFPFERRMAGLPWLQELILSSDSFCFTSTNCVWSATANVPALIKASSLMILYQ